MEAHKKHARMRNITIIDLTQIAKSDILAT